MRRFVYYNAASVGATLLLDLYPAAAAYSLRLLRTAYTGACIRVRRSSDNTEQDIGFSAGVLDTAALLSFVGAGDGFVVAWYDQQGSNNVTQGSSTAQPRIVNAGALETKGGKVAIKFDGSNDFLHRTGVVLNSISVSHFSVSAATSAGTFGIIHSQHTIDVTTIRTFCDTRTTGGAYRNLIVSTGSGLYAADLSAANGSTNQRLLCSFIDASKNMSAFNNGLTGGTNTYVGTPLNDSLRFGVQAAVTWLNGYVQEFIGYNTDESANRTAIETDINNYYAIY